MAATKTLQRWMQENHGKEATTNADIAQLMSDFISRKWEPRTMLKYRTLLVDTLLHMDTEGKLPPREELMRRFEAPPHPFQREADELLNDPHPGRDFLSMTSAKMLRA